MACSGKIGSKDGVMKALEKIGFMLFLLAGALALAGEYFGLPWLFRMALVAVGLMACVGGIRSMVKGEAYEGRTQLSDPRYVRRYSGVSARLIGGGLVLAGLVIIGLALMDLFNPGGAVIVLSKLVDSRYGLAIALGLAGLLITVFGIVRILSGSGASPEAYGPTVELGIKVGGFISALVGLFILLLAAVSILSPGLLTALFERAVHLAESLLLNP